MTAFIPAHPSMIPSDSTQTMIHGTLVTSILQRIAIGDVDITMAQAMYIDYEQDFFDVVIHGKAHAVAIWENNEPRSLDAADLAAILAAHPPVGKHPIRLVSCQTWREAASFAQQLANLIDVEVLASTAKISVYGQRLYFKEPGSWVLYHPESWQ